MAARFIATKENVLEVFLDLIAVCCSEASKNDKLRLLEAMAMGSGIEITGFTQASFTLDSILSNMVAKSLTIDQIQQDLVNLGMESEKIQAVVKCCSSRIDFNQRTDKLSLMGNIQAHQLLDMEWKFGVTAASSELDKVGATFLQLKLKVTDSSGSLENLNMELSLSQFYNFLHELEKTKTSLDYLIS